MPIGSGTTVRGLACGGACFGGENNSVALPAEVSDQDASRTDVSSCSPTTGAPTATARTQLETGSNRTCGSDATVDNAGALPGPGGVALFWQARLLQ